MSGTDTAGMVPAKYDIILDGYGLVFWNALLPSMPFRIQRASYAYSPTFLERTNISGAYGDNEQDFFLTAAQTDWSEGEGQRFFRGNDPDKSRRYWAGYAVDPVTVPGQVMMCRGIQTITPAADIVASCPIPGTPSDAAHAYVTTSNLYFISSAGSITSIGAHGAGTPQTWGICRDSARTPKVYIAGSSKIRLYDGLAAAFSDFSATTDAGTLAFINNALYSCDGSTLNTYSTAGVKTTLFTWKDAKGVALAVNTDAVRLIPFGGDLLIFFPQLEGRPQLWMYDGIETKVIADLPASVIGYDAHVLDGIVFLSGTIQGRNPFSPQTADAASAVIWAYHDGQLDEVWRAAMPATTAGPAAALTTNPALGSYSGKLLFFDASAGLLFNGQSTKAAIRQYDLATGAISTVALVTAPTATSGNVQFSSKVLSAFLSFNGAYTGADSAFLFPDQSNMPSAAVLVSSVFDFDNSLNKVFRSVRVDWEGAGSVDLAYAVDQTVTAGAGSWTALQTTAVSGTEYLLGNAVTGHEIQVRVTFNPGAGVPPTLKRLYVRAAPLLQSYPRRQYVVDLTGRTDRGQESNPVVLRDGSLHALTGLQMATNLIASINAGAPVSVTDGFGTYQAVFEQGNGLTEIDEVRPGEYIAQVTLRGV